MEGAGVWVYMHDGIYCGPGCSIGCGPASDTHKIRAEPGLVISDGFVIEIDV